MQYGKVAKLTSDAKFEESDINASIAAISFILSSAAKYSVDGDSLENELQQHQQLRAEGSNTLVSLKVRSGGGGGGMNSSSLD